MGGFNEILAGRFNRALQKLFSMKGSPPVPTLGSEIMPIQAFLSGVENRYLEGWNRFGDVRGVAAVAAVISFAEWRNPSGSNIIACFEKITFVANNVADRPQLLLGPLGTDAAIATPSNSRLDPRGTINPTLVISTGSTVPAGPTNKMEGGVASVNGSYDFILTENSEVTVLPGDALIVNSSVVNTAFRVAALWRERFLEDSERT